MSDHGAKKAPDELSAEDLARELKTLVLRGPTTGWSISGRHTPGIYGSHLIRDDLVDASDLAFSMLKRRASPDPFTEKMRAKRGVQPPEPKPDPAPAARAYITPDISRDLEMRWSSHYLADADLPDPAVEKMRTYITDQLAELEPRMRRAHDREKARIRGKIEALMEMLKRLP